MKERRERRRESREARLGIDIGRVIIGAADPNGHADTSMLSGGIREALRTPACPDALEVIAQLAERLEGRVWLVSKCGPRVQEKTRAWLAHHRFFERTGVAPDHLRFCLKRPEKRIHTDELGITHFIDDRLDVLRHLRGGVPNLYWFGHQKQPQEAPAWVQRVIHWRAVWWTLMTGDDALPGPERNPRCARAHGGSRAARAR